MIFVRASKSYNTDLGAYFTHESHMELTDVVSRPYSRLAIGSSLIRQLLVRKQAHINFTRTKIISSSWSARDAV